MAKTTDPDPVVLADRELIDYTDGYMIWDSMCPEETVGRAKRKTGRPAPNFTVAEVAKLFFGKDHSWLRWRIKEQHFFLDGEEIVIRKNEHGHRYFSLADIERMAHSLAQMGALNGAELQCIMIIIRNVAKLHRIIR